MPDLNTSLHKDMLTTFYEKREREPAEAAIYGIQWGDPESIPPLRFIRDRWVIPYVRPDETGLEIGPGGGRWTRYLLGFQTLYVVDYYMELLRELRKNLDEPNMVFVKNNGNDFPSIPDDAVDFIFSFGTFVHLDRPIIEAYLGNMARVLKPGGIAAIQYSDKTKVMAQELVNFSQNTPDEMRTMVSNAGFRILEEDTTTLWHASMIRFTR